jgi:hypothetical protein
MIIFISDIQTVVVRSPQLGDTETIPLKVRLHRAMDGTLWSYKLGPKCRIVSLQFRNLTRDKIVELYQFFKSNSGQIIQYSDYDGEIHRCRILPTDLDSEDAARNNSTFDIELEYV